MFKAKAATVGVARTGSFVANGAELATPNFMISTCRGAVPHLTPEHAVPAPVAGVYAEEMWDRSGLVDVATNRAVLPLRAQVVLGACRRPYSRRITNKPNTNDSMGIDTVQGSRLAPLGRLMDFMVELEADVFVVPYDVPAQSSGERVGGNRLRKMQARSLDWMRQFAARREQMSSRCILVAPIPPELRDAEYVREINTLCEGYCLSLSDEDKLSEALPIERVRLRLSDRVDTDWISLIDEIAAGADLVTVPIESFSNRGLALTLTFAGETPECMDLSRSEYTTDMSELGDTGHALAYIHHMLEAREMTAQVLLQQHNMAVVTQLFSDIREAIETGNFAERSQAFKARYGGDSK